MLAEESPAVERPRFFGFLTPVATNPHTSEQTGTKAKPESPILTKLEIDKPRRKLNFAECHDDEPEDPLPNAQSGILKAEQQQNDEELSVEGLLTANVVVAPIQESGKQSRLTDAVLGSPGSVLGIHRNNGFTKRPCNREERIEMKICSQSGRAATNTRKASRQKDLAPNGIRKSPIKSLTIDSKAQVNEKRTVPLNTRTSPRKSTKGQLTSAKKDLRQRKQKDDTATKSKPRSKPIRGMQLYQFTESNRTLRSAASGGANRKNYAASPPLPETPKKNQSTAKS